MRKAVDFVTCCCGLFLLGENARSDRPAEAGKEKSHLPGEGVRRGNGRFAPGGTGGWGKPPAIRAKGRLPRWSAGSPFFNAATLPARSCSQRGRRNWLRDSRFLLRFPGETPAGALLLCN